MEDQGGGGRGALGENRGGQEPGERAAYGARTCTRWVCARCEIIYKTRGVDAERAPRARERVGCCSVCRALVKTKRASAPGALAPDVLAAMERLGRHVIPMKRRDAAPARP